MNKNFFNYNGYTQYIISDFVMGAIISDLQIQIQKYQRQNGASIGSDSSRFCRQTDFQRKIQKQMNVVEAKSSNNNEKGFKIYEQKEEKQFQMSSISPRKLGKLSKIKNANKENINSFYGENSRTINFQVFKQDINSSIISKQPMKNYKKMYIKKDLYVNNNHEIINQLQQYLQKFNKTPKFRNILNLSKFNKISEGNLCTTRYKVEILFEYEGQQTLEDQIKARGGENQDFSIFEIMKIFKFLMNVIKQLKQHKFNYPVFSLSHLIISKKNKGLKYRNIIDSKYFSEDQQRIFYCPDQVIGEFTEKQSIFSFGMCMLSVCLLSDLSQCYNFHNNSVCVSLLEQRLEQLKQKYEYEYWQTFSQTICAMVAPDPEERPTLSQISGICNQFINQMRVHDCDSTQMMMSEISTCYRINTQPIKMPPVSRNNMGLISGRSCQKQITKPNCKKKQTDFSGSKCLTARWKIQSSEKKKYAINQTLYQKIIKEQNNISNFQEQIISDQTNEVKYSSFPEQISKQQFTNFELIDAKWKSQDQLFKNMPSFHDIAENQLQFELDLGFSKNISREPSKTQTLLSYRKIL